MADECIFCRSPRVTRWFVKRSSDDGRDYPIWKCAGCRSTFVFPRPVPEYLETYYTSAASPQARGLDAQQEKANFERVLADEAAFPNSSIDAERIARHAREMSQGERFLDIGAGHGFFSKAAAMAGFTVSAIEPTAICRGVFNQMNGFVLMEGMLNESFAAAHEGEFDVVLMSQVLEHTIDPGGTVRLLRQLLKSGGLAAIAVPHFGSLLSRAQGRKDMFIGPPEHLNFFSSRGLQVLFQNEGFKCRKMHTVSRVNKVRVARRVPVAGRLAALLIETVMLASDRFGSGMFLNAYFQKEDMDGQGTRPQVGGTRGG